jgi:hypothetical protein
LECLYATLHALIITLPAENRGFESIRNYSLSSAEVLECDASQRTASLLVRQHGGTGRRGQIF